LDRNMEGPDHKASSTPEEFRQLVDAVRITETSLGSPVKKVQQEEMQMRSVSRKSLVAASPIAAGTPITEAHLATRRPGMGLSPFLILSLLGGVATRDIAAGELLRAGDIAVPNSSDKAAAGASL